MNTGLTLVIQGADFSANNVGNSIFPSFANLKQALFYGNAIPDLSALKKAKGVNKSALGTAVVKDYAIKIANGDSFADVIAKLPNSNCSIALVLSRGEGASGGVTVGIAKSGAGANAVGDITFNIWDDGATTIQLSLPNVINTVASRATVSGQSPYFIAIGTFNSVSKEVSLTVANALGIKSSTQIATGLQENGSLYNTDTPFRFSPQNTNGMYFSAISVFDKALNADEIKELVDYYKEFYKDAPAPV